MNQTCVIMSDRILYCTFADAILGCALNPVQIGHVCNCKVKIPPQIPYFAER